MALSRRSVGRLKVLWKVSGEQGAKPRLNQFLEMIWLVGTCEFSPGEYWVYGFHLKEKTKERIRQYLPSRIYFFKVLPLLNKHKAHVFLENKWLFYLHFSKQLIDTPKCYGLFHPLSGYTEAGGKLTRGEEIESLVKRNCLETFIAKPVAGTNGRDVFKINVVEQDESTQFVFREKFYDSCSLGKLFSDRIKESDNCGFLIQEYVKQHEMLEKLSPSACMNLRIVTMKDPAGFIRVASASTRIGRVGSIVSNAGSGGMLAQVNLDNGSIIRCRSSAYIDSLDLEFHPDTGVKIIESTIPFWREAVEMCIKAADLLPEISSVGWDVLVKDDGPVLLEGNHDWDLIGEQLFGHGYLTNENRKILERHGLDFGYVENPKFRIGNVLQFFS